MHRLQRDSENSTGGGVEIPGHVALCHAVNGVIGTGVCGSCLGHDIHFTYRCSEKLHYASTFFGRLGRVAHDVSWASALPVSGGVRHAQLFEPVEMKIR